MTLRELTRQRVLEQTNTRATKKISTLVAGGQNRLAEELEIANEFAVGNTEATRDIIDGVVNALPRERQHSTRMQMLRQSKRGIMVEEALENTLHRKDELEQTGFNLEARRIGDSLFSWMQDSLDRTYAHNVVGRAMKDSGKKK